MEKKTLLIGGGVVVLIVIVLAMRNSGNGGYTSTTLAPTQSAPADNSVQLAQLSEAQSLGTSLINVVGSLGLADRANVHDITITRLNDQNSLAIANVDAQAQAAATAAAAAANADNNRTNAGIAQANAHSRTASSAWQTVGELATAAVEIFTHFF